MSLENEERIYSIILRMVLWDETKDDVFQKLAVNGFTGAKAQEMYERARVERITSIRADNFRRAGLGLMWLTLGAGVFGVFWFGFGGITRVLLTLTCLAMSFGTWKLVKGIVGIIMAKAKRGSLADED